MIQYLLHAMLLTLLRIDSIIIYFCFFECSLMLLEKHEKSEKELKEWHSFETFQMIYYHCCLFFFLECHRHFQSYNLLLSIYSLNLSSIHMPSLGILYQRCATVYCQMLAVFSKMKQSYIFYKLLIFWENLLLWKIQLGKLNLEAQIFVLKYSYLIAHQ